MRGIQVASFMVVGALVGAPGPLLAATCGDLTVPSVYTVYEQPYVPLCSGCSAPVIDQGRAWPSEEALADAIDARTRQALSALNPSCPINFPPMALYRPIGIFASHYVYSQVTWSPCTAQTYITFPDGHQYSAAQMPTYGVKLIADWSSARVCPAGYSYTPGMSGTTCSISNVATIDCSSDPTAPPMPDPARTVGECKDGCFEGNPVNVATGNKFQKEVDFTASSPGALEYARYYNSASGVAAGRLGTGWRDTFDRQIVLSTDPSFGATASPERVFVYRPDGRVLRFYTGEQTRLQPVAPDTTETLDRLDATTWLFTDTDGTQETYLTVAAVGTSGPRNYGQLQSIRSVGGRSQSLVYDDQQRLVAVVDDFGKILSFAYDASGRIASMTDPAGSMYFYTYSTIPGSSPTLSYAYAPGPTQGSIAGAPSRRYIYSSASPPLLTNIYDESGAKFATWEYDSSRRVTLNYHGSNQQTYRFTYPTTDGTGTTVRDGLNATRNYSFTLAHGVPRYTSIVQAGSQTVSATRDSLGRVLSRTNARGVITEYAYNDRGLVTRKTEAAGTTRARTTETDWQPTLPLPVAIREFSGDAGAGSLVRTQSFSYDANGNVTTRTVADPSTGDVRTWSYTYDATGNLRTEDGPRTDVSDITVWTYYDCDLGGACGQVATVTNPAGQTTQYTEYNLLGLPTTIVDPNGVATTLTYDAQGRVLSRTVAGETMSFSYWPIGKIRRITAPDGTWIEHTYDTAQRLTQIADQDGRKVQYTLDVMGNRLSEKLVNASGTAWYSHFWGYDAYRNVLRDIRAANSASVTTTFTYDSEGNRLTAAAPLGRNSAYTYDDLNRLQSTTDAAGGVTLLEYDSADRITEVVDPRGATTTYAYNGFGDLVSEHSPDTGTTSFMYATDGRQLSSMDSRGVSTEWSYDTLGRVTGITYFSGAASDSLAFGYDSGPNGVGRVTSASATDSTLSWAYDPAGRVSAKSQTVGPVQLTVGYGYQNGRLSQISLPSGTAVTYGYAGGRPTSVSVNDTPVLSAASYYAHGPVASWTWGSGTTESRARNTDGNVSSIAGLGPVSITYDSAGRLTKQTNSANAAFTWTYTYDLSDRLTGASRTGQALGWAYDANGNRLSQVAGETRTYTYGADNNRLFTTQVDGQQVGWNAYDPVGNIIANERMVLSYGLRNRLDSVTREGVTQYTYNALGQRVRKSGPAGTTHFVYDEDGRLLGEYDADGALIQETVWLEDLPVATLRPDGIGGIAIFYVTPDHLGTPRIVRRASDSAVVWRWDSDPFGAVTPNEDPSGLGAFSYNLRFPGQYADAESGLNYNYFRDYDPAVGRYVESDPIGLGGGLNTYTYVSADPMGQTDPTGEFAVVVAAIAGRAAIGAGIEIAFEALGNYRRGCGLFELSNYDLTAIGIAAGAGAIFPGAISTGKSVIRSRSATAVLVEQLARANTANRIAKIESRISAHLTSQKDLILSFLGIKVFQEVQQAIYPTECSCKK